MVASYYGKTLPINLLREKTHLSKNGVSLTGISTAAESIGFRTIGVSIDYDALTAKVQLPSIIHWNSNHFVVLYKISKKGVTIGDPAHGILNYSTEEFLKSWTNDTKKGIALVLHPTPKFYEAEESNNEKKRGFGPVFSYLKEHKKFIAILLLCLGIVNVGQLIIPFLTQSIVDIGIGTRNFTFIKLILLAQFVLLFSRFAAEFIRNWILLHISTRINLFLLSDFLSKLMNLPLAFFEKKKMGDILQRIADHSRVEHFLNVTSLSVLFSSFTIIVFATVLAIYQVTIFLVFILISVIYFIYILQFMKKRRELDFKQFNHTSANQSKIIQIIDGVREIKLSGNERKFRWEWEEIQTKIFNIKITSNAVGQYQLAGGFFINESKNMLITFLSVQAVFNGEITLGMMLSIQYIIGQLNLPIHQLAEFVKEYQNAKISLERIDEVHNQSVEDLPEETITSIPKNADISIENLSFNYGNGINVLNDITFSLPAGKITAIVGASGSGKTTLLKLLLKIYSPSKGVIKFGHHSFRNISNAALRKSCGVVMQDGYIFADTIANNIAMGETVDYLKLDESIHIAHINEFIDILPHGVNTKIGAEGIELSQGQRQRILIARSVYKNPDILLFDEATSALDTKNERIIMSNLNKFYAGRTVLIIAHRLSTVKRADQIIVLENGKIKEYGNHDRLVENKGHYYDLIRNQLELEN